MRKLWVVYFLAAGVWASAVQATTVSVHVFSYGFSPNPVTIQEGDTVHWIFDATFHNVTSDNGAFPASPTVSALPATYDVTFVNAGTFPYYCSIHSTPASLGGFFMNGTVTVTAPKRAVTVSLTTSKSPTVYGEPATITATVQPFTGTGTPTGTVTFNDGADPFCDSVTLNPGAPNTATATCSTVPLPPGGHTIFATYNGDATFDTFGGANVQQIVNRGTTTTTLGSSAASTVPFGTNVTFTATIAIVAPGTGSPGGFVTMTDGASPTNVCTSQPVVGGTAVCSTTTLDGGAHPITAYYLGDANVDGSTSDLVVQKVTPPAPQNFVARASSTSQVSITFTPSEGTGSYNMYRQMTFTQTPFLFDSTGSVQPFIDSGQGLPAPGLLPDTTYLYQAEAVGTSGSGTSPRSVLELATTTIFNDPNLSGVAIKGEHIDSLRRAVNAVRIAANLLPVTFTDDPITNSTPIARIHIIEIRNALDPALAAMGFPSIVYTDPAITQNVTVIKAAHVSQPREATQ